MFSYLSLDSTHSPFLLVIVKLRASASATPTGMSGMHALDPDRNKAHAVTEEDRLDRMVACSDQSEHPLGLSVLLRDNLHQMGCRLGSGMNRCPHCSRMPFLDVEIE